MQGREFLELAQELLPGTLPRHWRAIIIHAYYGLLLECRDVMDRWGIPPPSRNEVHAKVRLRLVYATDPDLKQIGYALEDLIQERNTANYDLRPLPMFTGPAAAQQNVQIAINALALLDAIDSDAVRQAAAAAAIRP